MIQSINFISSDFGKYLPLIAAVIAATLSYILGGRSRKNDVILQSTKENLKDIISPMYNEIELRVKSIGNAKEREKLLDDFFERYTTNDTVIYKLGSLRLIDEFYDLYKKYKEFKGARSEKAWKEFWWEFDNIFFPKLKDNYRNSINLIYRDFNWQQYILTKSYWKRFYHEVMKFLLDTMKGVNIVSILSLYFSVIFKIAGLKFFPDDLWKLSIMLLLLSLALTGLLILFNIQYLAMSSISKQSFERKIVRKIAPNLLDKWDNMFLKKDYESIPKMYDKKTIEE